MPGDQTNEMLLKVESVKNMLVARATNGSSDDSEYRQLRKEIIADRALNALVPDFLKTCRTLDEFWGVIASKSSTYAGRRRFIAEQFDSVLTMLEGQTNGPADIAISEIISKVDAEHINNVWTKALDRRATDPDGAITMARTLLETVCKHILDKQGIEYEEDGKLPRLYAQVSSALNMAPNQHSEEVFRKILGGCHSVVVGLGELRNKMGDSHAPPRGYAKPASRHAELAVNLAGAMAMFLLATCDARNEKQ